jgi:hypothetical protein
VDDVIEEGDDDQHSSFKWLHVRRVRAILEDGVYILVCDCGKIERTCIGCRHALSVIFEVCGTFNLEHQIFNRRMLLNYYYQCLCSEDATVSTDRDMFLRISQVDMEQYAAAHPDPNNDGVPEPGAWANERQDEMPNEHNYGEHEALSTNPRRNQRVTKPTKSSCNIMHAALLENITELELTEHHAYLKDRLAAQQRRAVPLVQGSHGQRNRTTGVADCLHRPKHAFKDAKEKIERLMPFLNQYISMSKKNVKRLESKNCKIKFQ